jgi:hypothetical protein
MTLVVDIGFQAGLLQPLLQAFCFARFVKGGDRNHTSRRASAWEHQTSGRAEAQELALEAETRSSKSEVRNTGLNARLRCFETLKFPISICFELRDSELDFFSPPAAGTSGKA